MTHAPATQARIVRVRRPAMAPLLEIDDDGVPVFQSNFNGRQWSDDGVEPSGVELGDWPAELDD